MKFTEYAFISITIFLFINALCVLYGRFTRRVQHNSINCTCDCSTSDTSHQFDTSTRRHSSFIPPGRSTLNGDHIKHSFTRLGSDLNIPLSSCPPDSKMLTNWSTTIPLHESCPAAFIIGARKGGTTSLYQYLSHHPDFEGIHLEDGPTAGETFHFSARYFTENWRLYKSRFPKLPLMTGDASVGNLVNCKVPSRIFESCGNFSKILILLRNPVNRYLSNFHMRTRLNTRQFSSNTGLTTIINLEISSFYKSLINSGITIGVNERDTGHWSRYLCMFGPSINMLYEGLYYVHLMNWLCNYPSENILIMNSEEFYTNTTSILHQVYQFLGLSPLSEERMQLIASFVFNKGTSVMSSHQMLQETDHKKLRHFYNSFNNALTKLLQWDGITW